MGLDLEPHHVLALACDQEALEAALRNVPCRLRPKIRSDHRATESFAETAPATYHGIVPPSNTTRTLADDFPRLQIERTFLSFPIPLSITEASSSGLMHSAPPGRNEEYRDSNGLHAKNPRRWG